MRLIGGLLLLCLAGCGDRRTAQERDAAVEVRDSAVPGVPDAASGVSDASAETDASAQSDAAVSDDASLDAGLVLPVVETRGGPECSPLEGAVREPAAPVSHFFAICGYDEGWPDRAFTWTAPERGLYQFSAFDDDSEARGGLELRFGDCVLTPEEGADSPLEREPVCAGTRLTENGGQTEQILLLEQGDVITVITDGDDYYLQADPPDLRRQSLLPGVAPVDCVGLERVVDDDWLDITSLPAELPLQAELVMRVRGRYMRPLSCSTPRFGRQAGVRWAAPEQGRYRFSLREHYQPADADAISLSLLEQDCAGQELACESDATAAELEHDLQAGQSVVLLLELADPSYDDIHVLLDVEAVP